MYKIKLGRVLYSNKETHWSSCTMKVLESTEEAPNGGISLDEYITCIGYFPTYTNVELQVEGKWILNERFGYQYEVLNFKEIVPTNEEGIIQYLSSGCVYGLREKSAKIIVERFGIHTLEIFDNEPERLLEIKGIGRKKLDRIIKSYQSSKKMSEVVSYLAPLGVSVRKCAKIYNHFKDESMSVILGDPFRLCEISGFGFKTVDEIAKKNNIAPNDPNRIRAAYGYILEMSGNEGHMCLPQKELLIKVFLLLNDPDKDLKITWEHVERFLCEHSPKMLNAFLRKPLEVSYADCFDILKDMAKNGKLKGDNGLAYLPNRYEEEVEAAEIIAKRIRLEKEVNNFSDDEINNILSSLEQENNIFLATKQKEAVKMGVKHNTCIITGGPGTGKTTCLKLVLLTCQKLLKVKTEDVLLLAPTGRAASRMGESVGEEYTASTIHSALKIRPDDAQDITDLQEVDSKIVVVDESSMMDSNIFYKLLLSVPEKSKLIFIGDPEQLPSVGSGNVLYELLHCKMIPTTRLDTIYRQTGTSPIAINAGLIQRGITNLTYDNNFQFIQSPVNTNFPNEVNPSQSVMQACADEVVARFIENAKISGIDNVQILCPYRKKGVLAGAYELNRRIQEEINPPRPDKEEILRGETIFRVGDKIIQTKNNYSIEWRKKGEYGEGIFNGDVGYIRGIDDDGITIDFDGKIVLFDELQLEDIDLAYAISIHKSQGSEYDTVIIPVLTAFYNMLKRNLIYTGITRAKRKCVIVGHAKALSIAIRSNNIAKRNTLLGDRIINNLN